MLTAGWWLAALCLLTRTAFLGRWPEAWDSVNFLLALERFDVPAGQPHFPGYPVYIAVARILLPFTGDPATALILAGGIGSSLAVFFLHRLTARLFGPRAALAAGLLAIANPFLFLEAEKLFSDAFALLFVATMADRTEEAAGAAKRDERGSVRAGYFAGLAGGLLLGVRVSALPLVLTAAAWLAASSREGRGRPALRASLHGGAHGVGLWLIPLILLTGSRELWEAGQAHLSGHFTEWGGSAATRPDWGGRLLDFAWCLGANGLGLAWPDAPPVRLAATFLVPAALLLALIRHRISHGVLYLGALSLPYAAWVLVGQNLENPRHVLPLVLLLLPLIGAGLADFAAEAGPHPPERKAGEGSPRVRRATRRLLLAGLLFAWVATAYPLLRENRGGLPTRIQLVDTIRARFDPAETAVVCWNSARFFDWAAPEWAGRVVGSVEEGIAIAGASGILLVVSDMPNFEEVRRRLRLQPLATFRRDRYVQNALHTLALYRVESAARPR